MSDVEFVLALLLTLVVVIAFGMCGAWIMSKKYRSTAVGFVLGAVLGLIGIIIALILPRKND